MSDKFPHLALSCCQHGRVDEWIKSVLQYGSGPMIAAGALLWQQARTDKRDTKRSEKEIEERAKDRVHERELAEADRSARLTELEATLHENRELADAEQTSRLSELAATLQQGRELADAEQAARLAEMTETLNHERETREQERTAENAAQWRTERRALYSDFLGRQEDIARRLMRAIYGPDVDAKDNFVPGQTYPKAIDWEEQKTLDRAVAEIQLLGSAAAGSAANDMITSAVEAANEAYYSCRNPHDKMWSRADAVRKEAAYEAASVRFLEAVRRDLGVDT